MTKKRADIPLPGEMRKKAERTYQKWCKENCSGTFVAEPPPAELTVTFHAKVDEDKTMIDIRSPKLVEVEVSPDGTLWVNVDGRCRLRCSKVDALVIRNGDLRKQGTR